MYKQRTLLASTDKYRMHPLYIIAVLGDLLDYLSPSEITRLHYALRVSKQSLNLNIFDENSRGTKLMSIQRELIGESTELDELVLRGYEVFLSGDKIDLLMKYIWNPEITIKETINVLVFVVKYELFTTAKSKITGKLYKSFRGRNFAMGNLGVCTSSIHLDLPYHNIKCVQKPCNCMAMYSTIREDYVNYFGYPTFYKHPSEFNSKVNVLYAPIFSTETSLNNLIFYIDIDDSLITTKVPRSKYDISTTSKFRTSYIRYNKDTYKVHSATSIPLRKRKLDKTYELSEDLFNYDTCGIDIRDRRTFGNVHAEMYYESIFMKF